MDRGIGKRILDWQVNQDPQEAVKILDEIASSMVSARTVWSNGNKVRPYGSGKTSTKNTVDNGYSKMVAILLESE